jgi:hypothetical protein
METRFPKTFEIVLHLDAPEGATEEDAQRVVKTRLRGAEVISVRLLEDDSKKLVGV